MLSVLVLGRNCETGRLSVLFALTTWALITLSCDGRDRSPSTIESAKPESGGHAGDASVRQVASSTGDITAHGDTTVSATQSAKVNESVIVTEAGLTLDEFHALLSLYGLTREEFWQEARRQEVDEVEYVKYLKTASRLD